MLIHIPFKGKQKMWLNNLVSILTMDVKRGRGFFFAIIAVCLLSACSEKSPEDYLNQAKTFIQNGDDAAAVIELKNAIQSDPTNAVFRFELGKLYVSQQDFESAEKELSKALELGYPEQQIVPLLSEAYQRVGANVALVELKVDEQALTTPERLELNFRKLQSLLALAKLSEASTLIEDMSKLESSSIYKDLISAHKFLIQEDVTTALEKALFIYEKAPLNRDVLNFTARLYQLNQEKEKAAEVYEDYIKVANDDIEAKFLLAGLLVEIGEMDKAEVIVDELLTVSETNAFLNQLKGTIRSANEDYKNGLLYSERAIQFGRNDPKLRLIAGFSAYRLDDFEKAIFHFSDVERILADGHPALRFLVVSYLRSNQASLAIDLLPRLGDLREDDAGLLSRAAYDLLLQGNVDAAKSIIERAEELSTESDDLLRLGLLQYSINDEQGINNLQRAVSQSPESIIANTSLSAAYLNTGELEKALELAKIWKQASKDMVEPYLLEAEILQRQRNFKEAYQVLENVESFAPKNPALLVAQLRFFTRQSQAEAALDKANELLQVEPDNLVGLAGYFYIHHQQNNTLKGLNRVKTAFDTNPSNYDLALLLGRVALIANDSKLSLSALNTITPNRQATSEFWTLKGEALEQDNQIDAAEKHYEAWHKISPYNEAAIVGQLKILNDKREYSKANDLADNFLLRKDNSQIRILNAHFYAMQNDSANAKKMLAGLEDRFMVNPFVQSVLAKIDLQEGNFASALENASAAYEGAKTSENLFLLVRSLQSNRRASQINKVIGAHIQQFPDDLSVKLLYAERLIRTDVNKAIELYKEIEQSAPNNFLALNNLGFLLMTKGELDDALQFAERAYKLEPNNIGIVDTYAQVLVQRGELERAVEVYSSVMDDSVNNEDIVLNYIEALLKNGSTVLAKRRLNTRDFRSPLSTIRIRELRDTYNLDM